MPAPVLRLEDVGELISQAVFLQQSAHPDMQFEVKLAEGDIRLNCDASQITRALTNLLLNAVDSIAARLEEGRSQHQEGSALALTPGRIQIWMTSTANGLEIGVDDNGRGLPTQGRDQLVEPYVTTRAKGTGLGLAIVKKIMDDHNGRLSLLDADGGGASIRLFFPAEAVVENRIIRSARG